MTRVLLVDDEQDITELLEVILKMQGYDVKSYNNPIKALGNFHEGTFDIVVLDIRMPFLNGIEVGRELRKMDSNLKIGFLTSLDLSVEEFRRFFPDIKVSFVLNKPSSAKSIVKALKEASTEQSQ